jgi:hypothetical protein
VSRKKKEGKAPGLDVLESRRHLPGSGRCWTRLDECPALHDVFRIALQIFIITGSLSIVFGIG